MTESQQYKKKIQWRRDTIEDWSNSNPLLLDGEIVIVTMEDGSVRFKVGNGRDVFNTLPFQDDILRKLIEAKVDKVDGKVLSTNDFTDYDKKTLDDLCALKAFRAMTVGDVNLAAEDVEEVLRIVAGDNITLHVDPETHVITIASAYPTQPEATPTNAGLMSADDKRKIDSIEDGANNYQHPTNAGNKHIPAGGSKGKILRWSSAGTATWGEETTYDEVTSTSAGLMSPADKVKLDGITAGSGGGTEYVHPTGSGYNHIPAGGKEGQILRWKSDGTAEWGEDEGVSDDVVIDITPTDDGIKVTKGDGTVTEIEISGGGEPEVIPGAVDSTCADDGNGNITMSSYGYLPTVVPVETEGGVRLDITDVNGTRSTEIMHGEAPERGVDYWTEDDKDEIKAYVDETILGGEW